MSAIEELIKATVLDYAEDIVAETTLDQTVGELETALDEIGAAPDDGVDPVPPTGVVVTAGARALFVSWQPAPPGDRVETTEIEVSVGSTVVRRLLVRHDDGAAYVDQLEASAGSSTVTPAEHRVRVRHVDRYGRSSGWLGPILGTPDPSYVDRLKADTVIAGRIQALVEVTSSGKVAAGGASLGPDGVELAEVASSLSAPDVSRGSKITPDRPDPFAAVSFFEIVDNAETYPKRGVHVRADGTAPGGARRAQVRQEAIGNGNPGGNLHALLLIQGGVNGDEDETFVRVSPHLHVVGSFRLQGDLDLPDKSIVPRFLANNPHGNDPLGNANMNDNQFRAITGDAVRAKTLHGFHLADGTLGDRVISGRLAPSSLPGNLVYGNAQGNLSYADVTDRPDLSKFASDEAVQGKTTPTEAKNIAEAAVKRMVYAKYLRP